MNEWSNGWMAGWMDEIQPHSMLYVLCGILFWKLIGMLMLRTSSPGADGQLVLCRPAGHMLVLAAAARGEKGWRRVRCTRDRQTVTSGRVDLTRVGSEQNGVVHSNRWVKTSGEAWTDPRQRTTRVTREDEWKGGGERDYAGGNGVCGESTDSPRAAALCIARLHPCQSAAPRSSPSGLKTLSNMRIRITKLEGRCRDTNLATPAPTDADSRETRPHSMRKCSNSKVTARLGKHSISCSRKAINSIKLMRRKCKWEASSSNSNSSIVGKCKYCWYSYIK